jgi:mono/diheme cytochrome c family protein
LPVVLFFFGSQKVFFVYDVASLIFFSGRGFAAVLWYGMWGLWENDHNREGEMMRTRVRKRGVLFVFVALLLGQPLVVNGQDEQPLPEWGKTLYMLRCASCHGESGKGDGPAAVALKNPPANLTTISKKHGGTFPRADVMQFIDGERPVPAHGPRHMPVWGEVFRRERADSEARMRVLALTVFIESIQEK